MNFATAPSEVGVVVERLPQVVNGFASRFGTSVNEYAYLRLWFEKNLARARFLNEKNAHLKHFSDSVKKPAMGIDLLLVLGLQDQDDLDRDEVVRVFVSRQNQLRSGIDRKLCGILRNPLKPQLRG